MPRLSLRTSSKVKRSKVKVTRQLNAVAKNHRKSYLLNGKPASHHMQGEAEARIVIGLRPAHFLTLVGRQCAWAVHF